MPTANEILRDEAIRHAIELQQLQLGHLRELDRLFAAEARERIRAAVLAAGGAGTVTRQQVAALVAALVSSYLPIASQAEAGVIGTADEVGQAHRWWLNNGSGLPPELVQLLPWAQVAPADAGAVGGVPVLGLSPREWSANLATSWRQDVGRQATVAAGLGETTSTLTARLLRLSERLGRQGAERMARTAAAGAVDSGDRAWSRANPQLLKGWAWLATLDTTTCQVCGARDGEEYPADGGPDLPAHPRCRCVREPRLVSWRELGIPIDEVPTPWRASMDGRAVPGTLTYDDWLARTSVANQQAALGQARWQVWVGQGRPPLSRYVDGDRVRTLDEIIGRG